MAVASEHRSGVRAPGFGVRYSGCSSQGSVSVFSVLPKASSLIPLCQINFILDPILIESIVVAHM